jgi:hypothetical protein
MVDGAPAASCRQSRDAGSLADALAWNLDASQENLLLRRVIDKKQKAFLAFLRLWLL